MKKISTAVFLLLACLCLPGCDNQGLPKVGVVDMNILMKESVPGQAAQKFIESQENELQAAFDEIQRKLEKDPNNEKVLQELQQVYASSQQKIQTIGQQTVTKLFDGIQHALQVFRQKNGYFLLLRAEALESYDPALDVTRAALGEIDKLKLDFTPPETGEGPVDRQEDSKPAETNPAAGN